MSKLNEKKLTKHIWWRGEKYKIVQIIRPNKFDEFILIQRNLKGLIHEDSKTVPVDMILLDAHNDTFYPDTPKVREVMKRRAKEDAIRKEEEGLMGSLDSMWLGLFKRED